MPYPIYKTLQPAAHITVLNTAGNPIEGAEVTLISHAYPYGREKGRVIKATNSQGIAEFEGKDEWRMETLMIHGYEVFFWDWCVQMPGFVTYATENKTANTFSKELTVRLSAGQSTPCKELQS